MHHQRGTNTTVHGCTLLIRFMLALKRRTNYAVVRTKTTGDTSNHSVGWRSNATSTFGFGKVILAKSLAGATNTREYRAERYSQSVGRFLVGQFPHDHQE